MRPPIRCSESQTWLRRPGSRIWRPISTTICTVTRRLAMPAKLAFLDTNGWLALLNSSDALHHYADAAWTELLERGYSVVLTDWVVAETGNGLARTSLRNQFVQSV